MRMSRLFAPTLKESPSGVEVVSHELLLRAGMMRQIAAGIYELLPLGWRSVRKIEEIVREEMDRSGAQELLLPSVQPADIWKESGRWDFYGAELLRFKDRKEGDFCLGPTHEEVITTLVRDEVRSYRELPINLYQIQTKFRDEARPRAGLLRGREFIMKDAYSFHTTKEDAHDTYKVMYDTYNRIFERCGLDFRPVEADTGAIGGNLSHEFQVLADSGEDDILSCTQCHYTANIEKAEIKAEPPQQPGERGDLERVYTPGVTTAAEVAEHLDVPVTRIAKSVIFDVDGALVIAVIRGDLDVNDVKIKALTGGNTIVPASAGQIRELTGASPGFVSPIGVDGARVFVDETLRGAENAVAGANEDDHHYLNVSTERDFADATFADIRLGRDGDPCGRCGGRLNHFRGIEVGQVFYLGTKYSDPLRCTFLDDEGNENSMEMGCYGIGVTRTLSAAIEQNHDDNGIVWPMALAPYKVIVLPLQMKNDDVVAEAQRIYDALLAEGIEVLIDDRDARVGVKFNDADLIGIPLRVALGGRGLKKGVAEFKPRDSDEVEEIALETVVDRIKSEIAERMA